jgi:ribose/xylose/arabinose/galactoside ABC-type transport system permease subunit
MLRRSLDFAPAILLVGLTVVFALIDPRIVSVPSLVNIVAQATPVVLLGLGAFVVLLSGGIDLSAGVGVALGSVLIAGRLDAGDSLVVALAAGLAVMLLIGLFNGLVIAFLRIPPFVTTLATMVAVEGATLAFARKGVLIIKDPVLKSIGLARTSGLPNSILVVALIAFLAFLVMRFTRFGLRTYAIGSDRATAELAGIPVFRQTLLVYLAAGAFTFLTAALMVSRVPVVTPNIGGTSLLLDAIAAAVIGGTSIFGGRGTIAGLVAGAVIVSLFTNALRVFGVDPSSIDLYKGVIIMLALVADAGLTRLHARLTWRPT